MAKKKRWKGKTQVIVRPIFDAEGEIVKVLWKFNIRFINHSSSLVLNHSGCERQRQDGFLSLFC